MLEFIFFLPIVAVQLAVPNGIPFAFAVAAFLTAIPVALLKYGPDTTVSSSHTYIFLASLVVVGIQARHFPGMTVEAQNDFIFMCLTLTALFSAIFTRTLNRRKIIMMTLNTSFLYALFAIYCHWNYCFPQSLISPPYAGTRWVGGLNGPNEFGQFYVLMSALLAGAYLHGWISAKRAFVMFVIFGICIWYTYSRGSFIALAGTMAIAVVIYVLIERRIWPILLLGMAGAGVGYFILAKALDSFSTVREKATARDEIYEESLRLFLESPIFGKGFGGFADYSTLEFGTPHSDYLYFAISGGIVALLWLVVFQIYLLRRAWKSQFYPEFLMFIAFMASGLTFNNMVRGRLSIIYLIVTLAFLVTPRAVQRMKRVSEARQPQEA